MPPKPLANRTAIVTGASSGIGRAIAEQLGAAGAHVFLAGRTQRAMESSQKRIQEAGGQATVLAVDVRDPAQVQDLVDSAVRDTGRLDIMVNNAGVSYPAPIAEGDPRARPRATSSTSRRSPPSGGTRASTAPPSTP
jgi:NAD(P)-dependent dehydrogenase (short-subunit alcohol dehydrogenase family)